MLLSPSLHYYWFIKNMLIVLNVLFAITGLLVIKAGNSFDDIEKNFPEFVESQFISPAALVVMVGFILLMVSSVSCYGVHTENYNLINVSCIFFALVLILEILMTVFGYMTQGHLKATLGYSMNRTLHEYPTDSFSAFAVDDLQNQLNCCGVRSSQDWAGILSPSNGNTLNLPDSCCGRLNEEGVCMFVRNHGCLPRLELLVKRRANLLINSVAFILFIQTLGLMFSYSLVRLIYQQREDKNRAYNELRANLVNNYFQTWQIVPTNEKS